MFVMYISANVGRKEKMTEVKIESLQGSGGCGG
jgi:hypothetical protein